MSDAPISEREEILLQRAFEAAAYTPQQQAFLRHIYTEWPSGLLVDWQIRQLAEQADMITPFVGQKTIEKGHVLSHGLTEAGYDVCLSSAFQRYKRRTTLIDPANFKASEELKKFTAAEVVLKPGRFVLGSAIEHIKIPPFVMVSLHNKSTWARMELDASQDTIINPGSKGPVTLEIKNNSRHRSLVIREGDGIVTFCFTKTSAVVENGYQDGRYSGQNHAEGPACHK
jgi:deoxycytidine triphosphate deaminase